MAETQTIANLAAQPRPSTETGERSAANRHRAVGLLPLLPVAAFLVLVVAGAIGWGDPTKQDLANRLQPPVGFGGTWDFPLGTDSLGRDILARLVDASRLSFWIGLLVASISGALGILAGLLAGVLGGWLDAIVTGLVELVLAVPIIVIGLVMAATIGQGMTNVVVLLVLTGWISYAQVLRLQARTLIHADFVMASLALGASPYRVARYHVLPNALPQMIVLLCQQIAAVMVWEASLTYLGIGLPIERISLGGMIREGQQQAFEAPWIGLVPGIAIAVAVIGLNLWAEELQQWIDPVQRNGRHRRS